MQTEHAKSKETATLRDIMHTDVTNATETVHVVCTPMIATITFTIFARQAAAFSPTAGMYCLFSAVEHSKPVNGEQQNDI